ncbi:hypothetical protein ACLOJK_023208 [Asimina triloba]
MEAGGGCVGSTGGGSVGGRRWRSRQAARASDAWAARAEATSSTGSAGDRRVVSTGRACRFEMGHDRSGMELNLLMTGKEDSPRVTSVINVSLRPRQIWNELVVAVVMNGSDVGEDGPVVVGIAEEDDGVRVLFVAVDGEEMYGGDGRRVLAATGGVLTGGNGGNHGCHPIREGDGAPLVLHVRARGCTVDVHVSSRCPRPVTITLPAARSFGGGALQSVMAPKRIVDKGKAPMVEEEPKGPRTRSRSSALIIREQQERAREAENRATQMRSSSGAYEEDGLLYGQMPTGEQTRTEEVRMKETMGLRPYQTPPPKI